uniref:Uncharacterized protein n=1 Tax=Anguilla anguilla TaxID=7936 RepID=A0A0E9PHW7_ANGAN
MMLFSNMLQKVSFCFFHSFFVTSKSSCFFFPFIFMSSDQNVYALLCQITVVLT